MCVTDETTSQRYDDTLQAHSDRQETKIYIKSSSRVNVLLIWKSEYRALLSIIRDVKGEE